MKILIIHYRYYITGGPERYLFNLKKSLEDRGHEIVVFSRKLSQNVHNEYENYWVDNIGKSDSIFYNQTKKNFSTYVDMLFREFYSPNCKQALKRLIQDTHPDICYLLVYKGVFSPSVIDACKEMNLPIVNRISDYNPMCCACSLYRDGNFCDDCYHDADLSCLKHRCVKGSLVLSAVRYISMRFQLWKKFNDKIDAFVCTNGFMRDQFLERGLASDDKLYVIPTFFHETEEICRLNKSLPNHKILKLLYIGNIDESKGIYDLLKALSIVASKRQDFHLDIVGGLHKSENDKMLAIIKDLDIDKFVSFMPFKSDGKVFEYYMTTDVTILPARWPENLPNTLVESIFFHRPVVVPKGGSFLYTTSSDVAFYYDSCSAESLAKIIENILSNRNEIKIKSGCCEQFFTAHYSEKQHIESLINLFNKYIKK